MESKTTRRFRELLAELPDGIRQRAHESYSLFRENLSHPGLRFKKAHSTKPIFSARITLDYRAVGVIHGDTIVWFWIGKHSDYERLIERL